MGTSWLCGIVNSQDGTQGTSLPNFTYQSLVPLLPICKNTLKNKLSNSCIMDLLPHSQNKQSQKRAHTLCHLVCNWCPLFGTVDFSQTFQHSLVLCVNSWGTAEEAALMGEKAWKVSNWQKKVVEFPMVICTNIMLTAINNATNASIKRSLGQKSSKAITVYFSVHANLKVVWNFLENPSVLVALPVPNTDITIQ